MFVCEYVEHPIRYMEIYPEGVHPTPTKHVPMPGPPQTGPGGSSWSGMDGGGGNLLWVYVHIGIRILDMYLGIHIVFGS